VDRDERTAAPAHATGAVEFVPLEDVSEDATFRLREPRDVGDLAASIARLGQLAPVELRPLPAARPPAAARTSIEDAVVAGIPGPRWQVVAGFRRMEALRLLQRDRVLARIHRELSDEDAWALALAKPLLAEPWLADDLEALRRRLPGTGAAGWAEDLLEDARARTPVAPEDRERFLAFLRGEAPPPPGGPPGGAAAGAEDAGEAAGDASAEPGAAAGPPGAAAPAGGDEAETLEVTPDELALHLAVRLFELNQELATAWEVWREMPAEGRRHVVEQARYLAELFPLMVRETE
jgi:ParB-like chromosome segregation protein Spo0J